MEILLIIIVLVCSLYYIPSIFSYQEISSIPATYVFTFKELPTEIKLQALDYLNQKDVHNFMAKNQENHALGMHIQRHEFAAQMCMLYLVPDTSRPWSSLRGWVKQLKTKQWKGIKEIAMLLHQYISGVRRLEFRQAETDDQEGSRSLWEYSNICVMT
jgi:hypothetical protein